MKKCFVTLSLALTLVTSTGAHAYGIVNGICRAHAYSGAGWGGFPPRYFPSRYLGIVYRTYSLWCPYANNAYCVALANGAARNVAGAIAQQRSIQLTGFPAFISACF